jgi:hypothetical protein
MSEMAMLRHSEAVWLGFGVQEAVNEVACEQDSVKERREGKPYLSHRMKSCDRTRAHIKPMPTLITSPNNLNGVHENIKMRRLCCQDSIFNPTQYHNTEIVRTKVMSRHKPGRWGKTNARGIAKGALIAIRSVKEGGVPGMS